MEDLGVLADIIFTLARKIGQSSRFDRMEI